MKLLRKTNQLLYAASRYSVLGILVLLTATVSYQVLSRYIDAVPRIMWTEELSRAGLIWLVFLGAAFAFHERAHFQIELLPVRLGARVLGNIERVAQVVTLAVLVVLVVGSLSFFTAGFGRTSTMSGVSLAWSYLAMPVSFGIMFLRSLETFIDSLRKPQIAEDPIESEDVL